MLNKKSVDDINVKGQRVLVRCDFNVPLKDGKITDENRLVAALPTIKKLIADGGKVILCSHLGKVKTDEDKPSKTLAPVAARLSELLGQEVKFAADDNVVGPNAKAAVEAMKDGDVVMHTRNAHSMEDAIVKIILLEKELDAEIDRLVDTRRVIREVIDEVPDEEQRILLELRYESSCSWKEIETMIRVGHSQMFERHNRALETVYGILVKKGLVSQDAEE